MLEITLINSFFTHRHETYLNQHLMNYLRYPLSSYNWSHHPQYTIILITNVTLITQNDITTPYYSDHKITKGYSHTNI